MSDAPKDDLRQPVRARLSSWKEIAAYLEKDLSSRTAQRREAQEGLPVYRDGARVFAWTDELDRWKASRVVGPSVKATPAPPPNPKIGPTHEDADKSGAFRTAALVIAVILMAVVASVWAIQRPRAVRPPTSVRWGRLLANATSEGGKLRRFTLSNKAQALAATPDGRKVYAVSGLARSLSILHTTDDQITTVSLPRDGGALAMSPDGTRLYLGSTAGGIIVIDTRSDSVVGPIVETPGPIIDVAITPDGKKLFVAMSLKGVWRVLTATGSIHQVTNQVCPEHLAVDPLARNLYVSYQCDGPSGRDGHDSLEIFDVETERSLQIVGGPPVTGGPLSFAPDAQVIVWDGLDACERAKYDHAGCPSVPSRVFHFLRMDDRQFYKTLGMPSGTDSARFIDSQRLLFLGDSIVVMDGSSYTRLEKWDHSSEAFRAAVLIPNLGRAYVAMEQSKEIVALDAERPDCEAPAEGLVTQYAGDGTLDDPVGGGGLTAHGGVEFGPGRVGQAFVLSGKAGFLTPRPHSTQSSRVLRERWLCSMERCLIAPLAPGF
jgi:hypothetical protein